VILFTSIATLFSERIMPTIHHLGLPSDCLAETNQLDQLEQNLAFFQSLGYTLVEVDPIAFSTIINGKVQPKPLANFAAVLKNFDLRYSVHGLSRLNLAYDPRHDLSCQIMACQIEVCKTIGASRLVYHSGLQALDQVRYGVRRTLLRDDELTEGAQREVTAFKALAPCAADAGVIIGMENGDSHQWEHNIIAQFGLPREALAKHHARLYISPIVHQLEAIDHPNIAMTLDVAHLYIAAHDMDFDYLAAVSEAAPWTKHLHLNDNFGRLDWGFDHELDRWAYGEADIHLPPGWGNIPYQDVFAQLPDYEGDLVLEIKPGFQDYLAESLQTMQTLLRGENA
jgi:sugar phosphate isomerase/epimerase